MGFWDDLTWESSEADRGGEKRTPSSATSSSSVMRPPHSRLLLRSIGVPRPVYLSPGHDPRELLGGKVIDESWVEDSFFVVFFNGAIACWANDLVLDSVCCTSGGGEGGGEGVDGGRW